MVRKKLINAQLILPSEAVKQSLFLVNGNVEGIGTSATDAEITDTSDLNGESFFPGLIDIHNHGAVGRDVNNSTAEDLLEVAEFLAHDGVTSWLPTLVPDSDENYGRAIGEI